MSPGDAVEVIAPWWHQSKLPRHVTIERLDPGKHLLYIVSTGDRRHWALAESEIRPA